MKIFKFSSVLLSITTRQISISASLILFLSGITVASTEFVRIEKLSDRVLLAYWLGTHRANLVAVKSNKGLVMIDTEMSPRIMAPIKEAIEMTFRRNDWKYVINLHGHMHHIGGNCLFENAVVIGHDNLPADMRWLQGQQLEKYEYYRLERVQERRQQISRMQEMLKLVPPGGASARRLQGAIRFCELHIQDLEESFEVVQPTVTFPNRYIMDLEDIQIEMVYYGKGHSPSDIIVYIPQGGVLFTGAACYRRLPGISEKMELSDIQRHIDVLSSFLKPDKKINYVIPSHSPPGTKKDVINTRDYYKTMLDGLRKANREDLSLEQIKKRFTVQRKFHYYYRKQFADEIQIKQDTNIERLWKLINNNSKLQSSGSEN